MLNTQTVAGPPALTQLLRTFTPEINSFAGWLVGLPTLHSLEDLSATDRQFIGERLQTDGARLVSYWQTTRTMTPLSDDAQASEWLR